MTSEAWEVAFEEYKETIPSPARDLPSVSREYYFIAVAPVFRAGYEAAAPRWIPVEERPQEEGRYLVIIHFGEDVIEHAISRYYCGRWQHAGVCFWRPLPPLPEGK